MAKTFTAASIAEMAVASPEQYLADLNPAQREAVVTTEGPLLVVAGAGSGKTRVLTYRVAHLINACGVKPNEILAITFTNKAAGEMRERLEDLLGPVARTIWILTFHAACGRILRREAQRLGYRSNFTIYDSADQVRLTKACLEELEKDPKRFVPRGIHSQISAAKNQLVTPAEYAERVASFYDQTVAEAYDLYQRRLFASNAVDFDDLLMLTVQVLERFPEARERWQKAFRYVLVDEYQDTNHAQYRLLQLLAEKHRNVCAVGDPDQSIYAFRGADIRNILEFERDFGETKTVALEQNYRSTNTILQAANAVIEHNRERKPKNLWSELGEGEPVRALEVEDEHAEARFVAAEIAALVEEGFGGSEIAVFYRTNAQSRVLEDVLVRQGVAYQVIGGPRFYERAEVKDVIAYLQAIDNPYDAVSLQRIANRPRRGIGDASLARLQAHADAYGISLWEALGQAEEAGISAAPLQGGAAVPRAAPVADGRRARHGRAGRDRARARAQRLPRRAAGRADDRGPGPDREPAGARRRRAGVPAHRRGAVALGLPAGDLALLRPGRAPRRAEPRHADDAAQREGARVPRRLHDRDGGGDLPARPLDRGAGARGGAAARLRRHDARPGAARAHARERPLALGQPLVQPASRFLDELPDSHVERSRLQAGLVVGLRLARRASTPRSDVPSLSTGDSVRHETLGEGVVTAIERGGLVTVRFASDGSERRLMLDYAPLERIA